MKPDAIGLWAFSEGAYIAPMVAAGNPQIAAVMVVSPSAIAAGLASEEWEVRNSLDVGGAGAGAGGAVSRYYALASDLADADLSFEPDTWWRRVSQPVLAVWGSADAVVPVHDSATALNDALAEGGANHDRAFRVFGGASHVLGVESQSNRPGSAPGFKELSAEWLRDHLDGRARSADLDADPAAEQRRAVRAVQDGVGARALAGAAGVAAAAGARAGRCWACGCGDGAPATSGPRGWWWPAAVVGARPAGLCALAFAVVDAGRGRGTGSAGGGGGAVVLVAAWLLTLAAAVATACWPAAYAAPRARDGRVLASPAWLLLGALLAGVRGHARAHRARSRRGGVGAGELRADDVLDLGGGTPVPARNAASMPDASIRTTGASSERLLPYRPDKANPRPVQAILGGDGVDIRRAAKP